METTVQDNHLATSTKINWDWILENMRYCNKCGNYKVLDSFEGQRGKCKKCAFHYRKPTGEKSGPQLLSCEAEVQANINKALTGSSKVKIKLTKRAAGDTF